VRTLRFWIFNHFVRYTNGDPVVSWLWWPIGLLMFFARIPNTGTFVGKGYRIDQVDTWGTKSESAN